ncbi:restriction endonuclease [Pseudohongiella nitratireducens]|uniref:restriction endonuclease n=1 Tax=Pseudohongiella nitratireducens TaxID=1768907 RepID=UPI0030EC5C16
MANGWMIRAGRGGKLIEDFESGYISIGWNQIGDLNQFKSVDEIRAAYIDCFRDPKPSRVANAVAMLRKFRDEVLKGDTVISYSSERREYLVGEVNGPYQYVPEDQQIGGHSHVRAVKWIGVVSRDVLPISTRNSLGSTLTLFSLSDSALKDIMAALHGKTAILTEPEIEDDLSETKDQVVSQAHELIKDKILALQPEEMEELVAVILRAMGYKTKVSPRGPDRGVDVQASPDGLGLTQPRIKVEVKHRSGSMGSQAIRSFVGVLRNGDTGLYVSTGGFSKEARYEAERATFPVTLIDTDDLADLIVAHYDNFDLEGRALLPLIRVYWPAE